MEEENEPSIKVGSDRGERSNATVADLAIAAPVARNTRFSVSFHRPDSIERREGVRVRSYGIRRSNKEWNFHMGDDGWDGTGWDADVPISRCVSEVTCYIRAPHPAVSNLRATKVGGAGDFDNSSNFEPECPSRILQSRTWHFLVISNPIAVAKFLMHPTVGARCQEVAKFVI